MEEIDRYLDGVQYIGAESISTRLGRGITSNPAAWDTLVAIAQRVLGHYQNESRSPDTDVRGLYSDDVAKPLIAAARILSAASDAAHKDLQSEDTLSESSEEEVSALSWMAASAYAAAGNFPSAAACLKNVDMERDLKENPYRRLAFALLNPNDIGTVMAYAAEGAVDVPMLVHVNELLATGDLTLHKSASDALDDALRTCASAFDIALLRSARLALRHFKYLSTVAMIASRSSLPSQWAMLLGRNAPATLLPAQWAVLNEGLLENRDNTLITLPTSTGKTLLAQFAILSDLLSCGGIGVFVAPYIAVARQTTESLRRLAAGLDIKVSSVIDPGGIEHQDISGGPQVFIVTPERLEALLSSSLTIDAISIAVFDEAHLIESGVRGARLESLLTRFRLKQRADSKCRLILMSAVLENVSEVRQWLGVAEARHHDGRWRPTARRVALWEQSGRLSWIYGTDPVRPANASGLTVLGHRQLSLVEPMYATELFSQMTLQWPLAYKNVAYLVDQLRADIQGPALIVCMTRRATRGVAHALANRFDEINFGPELQALEELIAAEGPHLFGLLKCLKHGVAFHNASVPSRIRAGIESALREGELRAIASTTTLAEGADLPFRLTVLYDWLQGFGDNQRPLSPLLFRNIAGRAGRAGSYVEGDTVVFENVLGKARYTRRTTRGSALLDVISASPKLRSPFEEATLDDRQGISAAFETGFVAAIDENPGDDHLAVAFSGSSFSARVGYQAPLTETLQAATQHVLLESLGGPIGVAASPIRLTDFGRAVRSTNLSPSSARVIMALLPTLSSVSVDDAVSSLLLACGALPEQSYQKLRDLAKKQNTRFVVKRSDLSQLSGMWRSDVSLFDAFIGLSAVAKSTRKRFAEWRSGEDVPDWDSQYDAFVDFMESAFGAYVPLLARSASILSPFTDGAVPLDWIGIAHVFETRSDLDVSDAAELLLL
jgi:helicase